MFYFEEIGARTVGHGAHFSIRAKGGNTGPRGPRRWRYKLAMKLHHRSKHSFAVQMVWFPQLAFQRDQQPNAPSPLDEVMAVVLNGHYFYEFTHIVCCPI
jgi:hypothetical protein